MGHLRQQPPRALLPAHPRWTQAIEQGIQRVRQDDPRYPTGDAHVVGGITMDVKRHGVTKRKRIRTAIVLVLVAAAVSAAGWRASKLQPAAPSVERGTVLIDSVKRGPMLRDVHGIGTLVPEEIVWLPAAFDS